jgi:hypothetical protein
MKHLMFCTLGVLSLSSLGTAQLLCVQCFEQNDRISADVNDFMQNGGFETSTCMPGWFSDVYNPNSNLYNCDIANWIATGGDDSSYPSIFDTSLSTIPEGNVAAYFGNGNAFPCSTTFDDTSCISAEMCVVPGIPTGFPRSNPGYGEETGVSLEQTVSGLTAGENYVLEFWAGGEPLHDLLLSDGVFAIDVGFGKTFLRTHPTGNQSPVGTRFLVRFQATSSSHTIKFTNWGHICIDCTELVLDDVRLYPEADLPKSVSECTSSTTDIIRDRIATYPNPFYSSLSISTKSPGESHIYLYNSRGQEVLRIEFIRSIVLNTASIQSGVYYYMVVDEEGKVETGKLVKF